MDLIQKRIAIIGVIIALIGVIVKLTVPEIRELIGLDDKSECEKNEILLITEFGEVKKELANLDPIGVNYTELVKFCKRIADLEGPIMANKKCPKNTQLENEIIGFSELLYKKDIDLIKKWDNQIRIQNGKEKSKDLFYKAVILEITLVSKKFCEIDESLCKKNLKKACENVLYKYQEDNFVVN